MEKYKLRVENEAESKEAQGLFFALGCKWQSEDSKFLDTAMDSFYILVRGEIMTYDSVSEVELNGGGFGFKELTLPELRDLVVLKLNSKASQVEHDYKEISQEYKHYKKDVSNLNSIDVYRVLKIFDVKDPALQHAVKKILCAGDRGTKDKVQDIQEAIASLNRFLEMIKEDDDIPF